MKVWMTLAFLLLPACKADVGNIKEKKVEKPNHEAMIYAPITDTKAPTITALLKSEFVETDYLGSRVGGCDEGGNCWDGFQLYAVFLGKKSGKKINLYTCPNPELSGPPDLRKLSRPAVNRRNIWKCRTYDETEDRKIRMNCEDPFGTKRGSINCSDGHNGDSAPSLGDING